MSALADQLADLYTHCLLVCTDPHKAARMLADELSRDAVLATFFAEGRNRDVVKDSMARGLAAARERALDRAEDFLDRGRAFLAEAIANRVSAAVTGVEEPNIDELASKHGFASLEDLEVQEHVAFPPEKIQ